MMPPVGKSGPARTSSVRAARVRIVDQEQRGVAQLGALCGGIAVAMPTAMPCEPLASRFGNAPGSTTGSLFGAVVGRAEIDRVLVDAVDQEARDLGQPRLGVAHGGGLSPSILPKLPCPSTSG